MSFFGLTFVSSLREVEEDLKFEKINNTNLRRELVESNNQLVDISKRYDALKTNYEKLNTNNTDLVGKIHSLNEMLEVKDSVIKESAASVDTVSSLETEIRELRSSSESDIGHLKAQVEKLTEVNESLTAENHKLVVVNVDLKKKPAKKTSTSAKKETPKMSKDLGVFAEKKKKSNTTL